MKIEDGKMKFCSIGFCFFLCISLFGCQGGTTKQVEYDDPWETKERLEDSDWVLLCEDLSENRVLIKEKWAVGGRVGLEMVKKGEVVDLNRVLSSKVCNGEGRYYLLVRWCPYYFPGTFTVDPDKDEYSWMKLYTVDGEYDDIPRKKVFKLLNKIELDAEL